jgi:integrase
VCVDGTVATSTHDTKNQAQQWAADKERELQALAGGVSLTHTVRDAFDRYAREVSPGKRGARWEMIRLEFLSRDPIADIKLSEIGAHHIAQWRDRDLNLISHCFAIARDEWRWMRESPTTGVRRPKEAPPRDRLITDEEISRILIACGYAEGRPVESVAQRVAVAFLFAIETAMRAGEICSLVPASIAGRVARLPKTKNGFPRDVPLSTRALELWAMVPDGFQMTPAQLDANFRKARARAGVEGITFHDTRRLATSRLSKKMDVLDLARMTGHRDLNMLMVYYNRPAEDVANCLD